MKHGLSCFRAFPAHTPIIKNQKNLDFICTAIISESVEFSKGEETRRVGTALTLRYNYVSSFFFGKTEGGGRWAGAGVHSKPEF